MKNSMTDLHNHLMAQMERLGEENLTPEQIKAEVDRSKAMIGIAGAMIDNARIVLDAQKLLVEYPDADSSAMPMLIGRNGGS